MAKKKMTKKQIEDLERYKRELERKAIVLLRGVHNWEYPDLALLFRNNLAKKGDMYYVYKSYKDKYQMVQKIELRDSQRI